MVDQYGQPRQASFRYDVTEKEFQRIRRSQKDGRNHDVTLYVGIENKLIVIAKHFYPPGLYRAPSGGINPAESFHDGINREVAEEIGCKIDLKRFLLTTEINFHCNNDSIFWRSFVFLADYLLGDFVFTDHYEIKEVRVVDPVEFDQYGRIMRDTEIGGLHYRADLHETVMRTKADLNIETGW